MGSCIFKNLKGPFFIIAVLTLPIYILLRYLSVIFYDIRIDRNVILGAGFNISHFGGINIEKCKIGERCSIHQNVVIRGISKERYPIIGDNVWIGSNAVIVGDVRIGSNATISASSYVTSDVSEGALVAGSPARVISQNYDNSELL